MGIQTIQDVRDMLRKGHPVGPGKPRTNDALQYLWRIHRNGKNGSEQGLERFYGPDYVRNTPMIINEKNLTMSFEEFSTDKLLIIGNDFLSIKDSPRNLVSPVVIIKFRDNYHLIDGNRRILYWFVNKISGPHRACVLTIKE